MEAYLRQGCSTGQAKILGAQSPRSKAAGLCHRRDWQLGNCFPGRSGGPNIALTRCQGCLKAPGRGQPAQHLQAVTFKCLISHPPVSSISSTYRCPKIDGWRASHCLLFQCPTDTPMLKHLVGCWAMMTVHCQILWAGYFRRHSANPERSHLCHKEW